MILFETLTFLDLFIVIAYLALCVFIGIKAGGKPGDSKTYFRTSGDVPWWAASFSIVATETSLLTVISIPAVAYGGSLVFLQLVFGYIVGRILVAIFILPSYFKGDLVTPYAFFQERFGTGFRQLTSGTFLITRLLADGVRLFAAAIPLKVITGLDYWVAISIIALLTLAYTYWGGLKSVIWIDVLQLAVYILCAFFILGYIHHFINANEIWAVLEDAGKLTVIQLPESFADIFLSPYNLVGAFIGGVFLTMASHGTDHLIVQRLLACGDLSKSRYALVSSVIFVLFQFLLFLVVGLFIYIFYSGADIASLGLNTGDEIIMKFVAEEMPIGTTGLFVAALFAAAMSTLSSSLSALSSSTIFDLFPNLSRRKDSLRVSRIAMVVWTFIFILFASAFTDTQNPVIELGLGIAGFTYGALLGAFLIGIYTRFSTTSAAYALIMCVISMTFIIFYAGLAWPWYTLIGLIIYSITASVIEFFRLQLLDSKK